MSSRRASDPPSEPPRTALVTGAGGNIGRAIARTLADRHVTVVVAEHPRAEAAALETVQLIRGSGGNAKPALADVTEGAAVERLCHEVVADLGSLDIVVNNAARAHVHERWDTISEAAWDAVIDTNLKSVQLVCKAAAPHMEARQWGRIVNIGSVTFLTGQENLAHYVAAKAGVVGLTRVLARVLGPRGITVNVVAPGAIEAPSEHEQPAEEEAVRALLAVQAVKRRGQPRDVAAAVDFLTSEGASFITGQMLVVDGGWTLH